MLKIYALASLFTFLVFIIVDFIWLANATRFLYKPHIGPLLLEKPVLPAAAIFYILYVFGLIFLVLKPAIDANSVINAIWLGGVFGLVAYGTYDLTNLATIRGWSVTVTLVDMLWGAFLTGLSAGLGVWISFKFN